MQQADSALKPCHNRSFAVQTPRMYLLQVSLPMAALAGFKVF